MDSIGVDPLKNILVRAADFRPALRAVCRQWRDLLTKYRSPLSVWALLARGHLTLVAWSYSMFPPSSKVAWEIMRDGVVRDDPECMKVARSWGHPRAADEAERVANSLPRLNNSVKWLVAGWTLVDFNELVRRAAKLGAIKALELAIEWGGTLTDEVIIEAIGNCIPGVPRFCSKAGFKPKPSYLNEAAARGSENTFEACVEWFEAHYAPLARYSDLDRCLDGAHRFVDQFPGWHADIKRLCNDHRMRIAGKVLIEREMAAAAAKVEKDTQARDCAILVEKLNAMMHADPPADKSV